MTPEERREEIVHLLQEKKNMKILELSSKLKVTRETIRKDLYELEEAGLIKKTHGGAVLDESNQESLYDQRRSLNEEDKDKIAELALDYIEDGDTIYLDYGTTTYKLAEKLVHKKQLTVITNTLPIITLLAEMDHIELIIPGGRVRKNEFSLLGPTALDAIENFYVDIGFFGCGGVNTGSEITNFHDQEVEISKKMIQHSTTSIILADHTKFGITAFKKTAAFAEVDIIITNEAVEYKLKNDILSNGTELLQGTKELKKEETE